MTPERKAELELLNQTHIGAVVAQRIAMQAFIKLYVSKKDPAQPLPDLLLSSPPMKFRSE